MDDFLRQKFGLRKKHKQGHASVSSSAYRINSITEFCGIRRNKTFEGINPGAGKIQPNYLKELHRKVDQDATMAGGENSDTDDSIMIDFEGPKMTSVVDNKNDSDCIVVTASQQSSPERKTLSEISIVPRWFRRSPKNKSSPKIGASTNHGLSGRSANGDWPIVGFIGPPKVVEKRAEVSFPGPYFPRCGRDVFRSTSSESPPEIYDGVLNTLRLHSDGGRKRNLSVGTTYSDDWILPNIESAEFVSGTRGFVEAPRDPSNRQGERVETSEFRKSLENYGNYQSFDKLMKMQSDRRSFGEADEETAGNVNLVTERQTDKANAPDTRTNDSDKQKSFAQWLRCINWPGSIDGSLGTTGRGQSTDDNLTEQNGRQSPSEAVDHQKFAVTTDRRDSGKGPNRVFEQEQDAVTDLTGEKNGGNLMGKEAEEFLVGRSGEILVAGFTTPEPRKKTRTEIEEQKSLGDVKKKPGEKCEKGERGSVSPEYIKLGVSVPKKKNFVPNQVNRDLKAVLEKLHKAKGDTEAVEDKQQSNNDVICLVEDEETIISSSEKIETKSGGLAGTDAKTGTEENSDWRDTPTEFVGTQNMEKDKKNEKKNREKSSERKKKEKRLEKIGEKKSRSPVNEKKKGRSGEKGKKKSPDSHTRKEKTSKSESGEKSGRKKSSGRKEKRREKEKSEERKHRHKRRRDESEEDADSKIQPIKIIRTTEKESEFEILKCPKEEPPDDVEENVVVSEFGCEKPEQLPVVEVKTERRASFWKGTKFRRRE